MVAIERKRFRSDTEGTALQEFFWESCQNAAVGDEIDGRIGVEETRLRNRSGHIDRKRRTEMDEDNRRVTKKRKGKENKQQLVSKQLQNLVFSNVISLLRY